MIARHLPTLPAWLVAGVLAWLATLVLAIWGWGRSRAPLPAPAPDTVRVSRTIMKADTVTESVPRTVIQYDTVRVTDTLVMPAPEGIRPLGIVPRSPLDVGTDRITLTYWATDRWQQQVYAVPRPTWEIGLLTSARASPRGPTVGAGVMLRHDRLRGTLQYTLGATRGLQLGLRWTPLTKQW